ncbi:MAG: MarR family transcriptional regulator [Rhodospirillaceae bacterium]
MTAAANAAMREDYDRNFGFLIHDVARLMRIAYDRRMKPLGLTRSQWWVLNNLYFNQGISQTDLAKILDVERATLGRLLDRLEAKDWIDRRPDTEDRRINRVYLSEAAQPTMQTMRSEARRTVDEALACLTPDEQSQMFEMLSRMKAELTETNGRQGGVPMAAED